MSEPPTNANPPDDQSSESRQQPEYEVKATDINGDIRVSQFAHAAHYNERLGRVEIYVVSSCDQTITVGDRSFEIAEGEPVLTEYSHKYTIDGFAELAAAAGLTLRRQWTDAQDRFAVLHFAVLD